jgi:hypothetical protein
MKHLKLLIILLLPISSFSQPTIQGFNMMFGFVRGTFDELPPGSDLDDATNATIEGRACRCGTVYLQNLSTQEIFGQQAPIGDDLVNGVYNITGGFSIQADEWTFGEVIEIDLPCVTYSGSLNFQVSHSADPNNPGENDQPAPCDPGDACRLRKNNLNTLPVPQVDAGLDQIICAGESVQLNATGLNVNQFEWSPSNGLNADDIPNPIASPNVTTTYQVEGSKTHYISPPEVPSPYTRTCRATDEITVTVDEGPSLSLPAETIQCNDDEPITLNPGSNAGATYNWSWQSNFGSLGISLGTSQTQSTLLPGLGSAPYGTYTVNATSINGCPSNASTEVVPINPNFGYTASAPSNGTVQFTFTDDPSNGTTHFWGVAPADPNTCAQDGTWLEYVVSSNATHQTNIFNLGSGNFYLYHGESAPGCFSPAIQKRCISLTERPIRGGIEYDISEYGGSKNNSSAQIVEKDLLMYKIYPNPTTDIVQIDFSLSENASKSLHLVETIELFSATGELLIGISPEDMSKGSKFTFDLNSYPGGLYLIKITALDGSIESSRIVKS